MSNALAKRARVYESMRCTVNTYYANSISRNAETAENGCGQKRFATAK